ncbi:MAG: cob(I)yrinic acid a,c-diamide adenosyltransferase [Candidatus Nanohaloarchaea archaeon]
MVYTGRGDEGETDLGSGESIEKDAGRIEAYGTVDELNSVVGLVASKAPEKIEKFEHIQNELHILQAELANMNSEHRITEEDVERLEERCDELQHGLPPLRDFILSGGTEVASLLHLARSVTRRAERRIVALKEEKYIRPEVLTYINRLSDLFFLMARMENHEKGVEEKNPDY